MHNILIKYNFIEPQLGLIFMSADDQIVSHNSSMAALLGTKQTYQSKFMTRLIAAYFFKINNNSAHTLKKDSVLSDLIPNTN